MHCVYCESREIGERTVFRTELTRCFLTNIPVTPGHLLVTPIRCVRSIDDVTDEEMLDLHKTIVSMKKLLKKAFQAQGFNCAWNEGSDFGQGVLHLHIHIVPRKPGDAGITEYEPRKFLYRPGSREVTPENELASQTLFLTSFFPFEEL